MSWPHVLLHTAWQDGVWMLICMPPRTTTNTVPAGETSTLLRRQTSSRSWSERRETEEWASSMLSHQDWTSHSPAVGMWGFSNESLIRWVAGYVCVLEWMSVHVCTCGCVCARTGVHVYGCYIVWYVTDQEDGQMWWSAVDTLPTSTLSESTMSCISPLHMVIMRVFPSWNGTRFFLSICR